MLTEDYSKQLEGLNRAISNAKTADDENEDFVEFALQFVDQLKNNWLKLSPENKKRGEQILFNGKIYADNSATVRSPSLSSIYRLGINKKDLQEVSLQKMVELPGTAPGSVGV